jgi:integrase/recombinase XerD
MREADGDAPSTERRRLSSFSSLFKHLVRYDHAEKNPVTEVERPAINRRHGTTLVFSKQAAAKLLSARRKRQSKACAIVRYSLSASKLACAARRSPRSRSMICTRTAVMILSGLPAKAARGTAWQSIPIRRSVSALTSMRRDTLTISTGLCFAHSVTIVRDKNRAGTWTLMILRKHVKAIGIVRGYSAHSMRATCVTTALENGCPLEDVQQAAGHAEPGTTKLYDRRGYNPEKSASFFATY